MRHLACLRALLANDAETHRVLDALRMVGPPTSFVAAGFIRDFVWNVLHSNPVPRTGDVDVIWFDPRHGKDVDRDFESRLRGYAPEFAWSVKNQARMHVRNHHAPYSCLSHAMRFWPETATCVAGRYDDENQIAVLAPFGLDDMFALRLRPTRPNQKAFFARLTEKDWFRRFPYLRLVKNSRLMNQTDHFV